MAKQHKSVQDNLAGVLILAGGLSTRMGSPKALLKLPSGETLLDYHVRHASELGVPVIIADNAQGFKPATYISNAQVSYVQDYAPQSSPEGAQHKHSAGPLGAIMAGLQHVMLGDSDANNDGHSNSDECLGSDESENSSKWLMVISCDSLVSATDVCHRITTKSDIGQVNADGSDPKVYCLADNTDNVDNVTPQKPRLYPLLALYQLPLVDTLQPYLDVGERRVMGFIQPISHAVAMPVSWSYLSNLNTPEQFQVACDYLFAQ